MLKTRIGLAVIAATAACALTGCGGDPSAGNTSDVPTLEAAYDVCAGQLEDEQADDPDAPAPDEVIRLEDEGQTVITGAPSSPEGVMGEFYALRAAACMLEETDAPTAVGEKMQTTTELMGRQDDAWGDYTVEWSYASGEGVEAFFEVAR